ncbi:hypothetical protein A2960_05985 [Candidatus Gottesmanbacteria bacterium RIFCSPLOWO2_01_FULL_39_12b]|uniref:Glycosyl transferase family 28 C-terminal domain-containing protein n=1 Tax=Candidatus Gottesmanbacteria bacterium RIFCSPLOWO2_01_FULL_39_12b TaxID=1798388 RepID=A0A1F6AN06_9BACT|nr:MAG: hypothetical protein A2960_05985 [Candidatus Gottesmanbacteria bacterium RIFCSPLOWO2_01_FULL_39_12b]
MAKVILLPVGIGLAHVGRLVEVAKQLQKKRIEVIFGAGGDAVPILKKEKFEVKILPELERSVYEDKIKHNNPSVYTRANLERFVLSEIALFKKEKPDLVVYDFRFTAKISASILKIPSVSILNVDMTPFYDMSKTKFPVQTTLIKYLPRKLSGLLNKKYSQKFLTRVGMNIIQALFVKELVKLSPMLLKLGFRPGRSPYQLFLGDLTLIADVPQFRPVKRLPENVVMVGPLFWESNANLPSWHRKLDTGKKIIYVTAGGTGDRKVFLTLLKYLKVFSKDYNIVATTGNTLKLDEVKISFPGLFVTDFLPGKWIMEKATLVIFPGGNSTCYQALYFGVPQICTPFHIDQEDNVNQLERLGTGMMINPYTDLSSDTLISGVRKVISDRNYKINCLKFKKILNQYDGAKKAAEEIVKLFNN